MTNPPGESRRVAAAAETVPEIAPESAQNPAADPSVAQLDFIVVAVGASAGGLETFRQLLAGLPPESGMAFVLLQHLDPHHKSLTAELLQPLTAMPVAEAKEGQTLVPNQVFLLPPNYYMSLDQGRLRLTPPADGQSVRLPIDVFLRSLAQEQHEKAVAVILTGGGGDGSQGIRAVVAQGGLVLVQDPQGAEHDGMPRSAIQTGVVDRVLPIDAIPEALLNYGRHSYVRRDARAVEPHENQDVQGVIDLLRQRTGRDFGRYKKGTLTRRIQRRMSLRWLEDISDYAAILRDNEAEAQALLRDLLIGVTGFFREPKAWEFLDQNIIAPLVESKAPDTPIRMWVAGCSTGEEAYSLTMLVLERLAQSKKRCVVEVFASDINRQSLEFARAGIYAPCVVQDVPPERIARWFIPGEDQQSFRVCPELRAAVIFAEQNLLTDPPFSKLDIITCRNLLIYLEAEVQSKAMGLFHFALREGGFLFLGNAETVGRQENLFVPVSKAHQIYRRIGATNMEQLNFPIQNPENAAQKPSTEVTSGFNMPRALRGEVVPARGTLAAWAQQLVLARHTRACVLVNSRFEMLCLFGPTQRYLQQPIGPLTDDLLAWVPEELRPQLRGLLHRAQSQRRSVTATGVHMSPEPGAELVQLTIEPVQAPARGGELLLVVFEPPSEPARVSSDTAPIGEPLVRQLERELRATRESLQASIQELEGTNEGLKAANEEVTSMNEELRSVNEEMETSKEELQSLNEELRTVNQQLQAKVQEADRIADDLRNVLASTALATLFLDRELRIRQYTPAMNGLMSLRPSDLGRPLADFAGPFANADLHAQAREVLTSLIPSNRELQTASGLWYLMHVLPYRTTDDRIDGVVITFTDISTQKHAEARLQAFNQTLELRVAERTTQLRDLVNQLTTSEERERRKLALALHDGLQQLLVALKMRAATICMRTNDPQMQASLHEVMDLVSQSIEQSRSLTADLAPPVLYEEGLEAALQWLAGWMHDTHHFQIHLEPVNQKLQIPENLLVFIFQAVREILFNAVKHSGVQEASIDLKIVKPQLLQVIVSDHGAGFDPATLANHAVGCLGLFGIRERLKLLGGKLEIQSAPGQGTKMTILVPLAKA